MKNSFQLILALLSAISILSCKKETVKLEQTSPDKKIVVTISGEKASSMDPYLVNINTKGYGFDETISTEIFSASLDTNTVHFKWVNNKECYFVFMQQDNTIRRMHLRVNDDKILLDEEGSTSVSD